MKTFNQLLSDYLAISKDKSTDNNTLGKILLNKYIRKILTATGFTFFRGEAEEITVINKQTYPLPHNCWRIEDIKVDGYYLKEIKDRQTWTALNRTPRTSSVIRNYWLNNNTVEFYPIPNVAGNIITFYFQKRIIDLGVIDYITGTVAVTAGSTTVTGTGTVWTSGMIGRSIRLGNWYYEITAVASATSLTIARESADTLSGASYEIAEMIPFPDGFVDVPLYGALLLFFQSKENPVQAREYERLFNEGLMDLIRRDEKSSNRIVVKDDIVLEDINKFPEGLS